ncbi:unnamed protein product [Cunninghamella echinulata]
MISSAPSADYYIIFDYSNNIVQNINFPTLTNSVNIRYAAIYNEAYLVTEFGLSSEHTAVASLSVLNISNSYQPSWIQYFSNSSTTNSTGTSNKFPPEYIAAIVVPLSLNNNNKTDTRLCIKETDFKGIESVKYTKLTIDYEESYNKLHNNCPTDNICKSFENETDKNDQKIGLKNHQRKTSFCINQLQP